MEFNLRIGESVSSQKLNEFKNNQNASDYLRVCIEALRNENPNDRLFPKLFLGRRSKPFQPLESPVNHLTLEEEVGNLPQSCILAKKGEFIIYGFIAKQAPTIMKEIARLRRRLFAVQERELEILWIMINTTNGITNFLPGILSTVGLLVVTG